MRSIAAVLALVAAACVSEPTAPILEDQALLFTSDRDGNVEIYSMHSDGGEPVRLTRNGATDFSPRWSPNGDKIVFLSNRAPGANGAPSIEIFSMNADGSGVARLTTNDVLESSPSWSPDGTRILYSTDGSRSKIFVMHADGSNAVQLTDNQWADSVPRWSPDGTRIAFLGNPGGLESIFTVAPDGTNRIRVPTHVGGKLKSYSWSPDSRFIAYEYGEWPYGGIFRTVIVPTAGVGPLFLVGWENFPGRPVWSPDGERIAFTISITGEAEIYTMRASDGGDRRNITNNPANDLITDWR